MTDIEIARSCKIKPITQIARKLGVDRSDLELYGNYKAKVTLKPNVKRDAKLTI